MANPRFGTEKSESDHQPKRSPRPGPIIGSLESMKTLGSGDIRASLPPVAGIPSQHNYKFILVGNSRVGKTSLTNRCIFDEFEEDEAMTRVC